jgi:hypothetical protein
MLKGQAIPAPQFFQPIADAVGLPVGQLLVEAGIISEQTLTETGQSQVESPFTAEDAADRLGITDPVTRELFLASVERLVRQQSTDAPGREKGTGGIAAEQ